MTKNKTAGNYVNVKSCEANLKIPGGGVYPLSLASLNIMDTFLHLLCTGICTILGYIFRMVGDGRYCKYNSLQYACNKIRFNCLPIVRNTEDHGPLF